MYENVNLLQTNVTVGEGAVIYYTGRGQLFITEGWGTIPGGRGWVGKLVQDWIGQMYENVNPLQTNFTVRKGHVIHY